MRHSGARSGFTLVEMLVVISIIVILVALLLVAVTQVIGGGYEVMTLNDLRQMTVAMDNFKAKFGVLPPSKIILIGNRALYEARSDNNTDMGRLYRDSYNYINALWPRIDWTTSIDWSGAGLPSSVEFILEGDQCLVFFLGGIPFHDPANPTLTGCRGFSSKPTNPTYIPPPAESALDVRVSFMQFDNSRLFARDAVWQAARHAENKPYTAAPSPAFYSYKDPWGTEMPYAFFSSGKRNNGYSSTVDPKTRAIGDCPSLILFGPYCEGMPSSAGVDIVSPTRYINPTRFQIISAGKNGWFGTGGPWSPALAATPRKPSPWGSTDAVMVGGGLITIGADDQANFYDSKLGVPQ
jgi:prepilin-type N-terminal cleavage/methylation domain-containing protein